MIRFMVEAKVDELLVVGLVTLFPTLWNSTISAVQIIRENTARPIRSMSGDGTKSAGL